MTSYNNITMNIVINHLDYFIYILFQFNIPKLYPPLLLFITQHSTYQYPPKTSQHPLDYLSNAIGLSLY